MWNSGLLKQELTNRSWSNRARVHETCCIHHKSCEDQPFVPTNMWSPRCNRHDRHYCYWWLMSCETASLWGKLRSSWILCISSSASWDADMSPRSPINSSVSCRRAFLWREWHKLQFKWLVNFMVCQMNKVWNNISLYKLLTILQVWVHTVPSALSFCGLSQTLQQSTACLWSKRQWEVWTQVHLHI